jgi:hypothetical protein
VAAQIPALTEKHPSGVKTLSFIASFGTTEQAAEKGRMKRESGRTGMSRG